MSLFNFDRLRSFKTAMVGNVSWQKPRWLHRIILRAYAKPMRFISIISALIILIVGGLFGINWYLHLPKPNLATAAITLPKIPPLSDKPQVVPYLAIDFIKHVPSTDNPSQTTTVPQSVAPLDKINKTISTGITLSPALPGVWQWRSDSKLVFYPTQSWYAGTTYTIKFDKNIFAAHVRLEKYTYQFTTQLLSAETKELRFYQNPQDPNDQKIVGTLTFNYPVDHVIANHIFLVKQQMNNSELDLNAPRIPISATFGKQNREVYIQSANIRLQDQAQYLVLVVDKKAPAMTGSATLPQPLIAKLVLPDAGSILKITKVDTAIVHTAEGIPQQALVVSTSIGISPSNLQKNIQAYLLPKDYPATRMEPAKEDYEWQSADEVSPAILKLATPVALQPIPADRPYPTLLSFRYDAPANRYLYVRINKDLPGYGGYRLRNSYQTIFSVTPYPKEISFLHKGSLLALTGEHKLSVLVRGIPNVKFAFNRVLPNQISLLVSQTGGDFNNPYFQNYTFNQNDITELFSEIISFNSTDGSRLQYTALDLDKYLKPSAQNAKPLGLFLLTGKSWDKDKDESTGTESSRLILITDMGMIVKNNADDSHDVFVQSIASGKPVADVTVEILGRNGLAIASGKTNAEGHVRLPSVKDYVDEAQPIVYVARKMDDVTFMPFDQRDRGLNFSRFDIAGVNDDNDINNLTAYVFSERGIYRPGDTIHFGLIVKQAFANSASPNIPVQAVLTDPNGTKVIDKKFVVNNEGLLTLDYTTTDTALSGDYTLQLNLIKDDEAANSLGSATVRVAEFLPDTMKITSALTDANQTGWVSPTDLGANINLKNLFGTPAVNHKITSKIVLVPQSFKFESFPGYVFHDPLYDPKKPPHTIEDALPSKQTDQQGNAKIDFNLARFDKATYQLTFYAQGFAADSGRSVNVQNTVLVSPLAYLIGYKTDGDISFVKQNSQRSINLVAVNKQLQKIALPNLTLQLMQLNKIATLVEKGDGTYQYETTTQEQAISKTKLDLPVTGADYKLATDKVGNYVLLVSAPDGTILNRINYSVVGESQKALQKNTELALKINKAEYVPGETINLEITAPYTGSGLITIERDKVYAYKWFTATTTNSVQHIQIPKNFVGNGYVNVTFVRDWNSPEIFLSPLSYSVAPFTVIPADHTIKVSLSTSGEAKSGEPLPIQYSTNEPSKIIVFAVDEGILQATQFVTPNPINYFFQKRALSVSTTQIVDQILPKFIASQEKSSVGGDGPAAMRANYLNPFKRLTEKPVVYWSGIIDSDSKPHTLTYTPPSYFNGSLRVMAVAVAKNAVGSDEKSSVIRNDFILAPNAPTVVAPGDKFDVSVDVTNNVKNVASLPIKISLVSTPGLVILGTKTQTLSIAPQQDKIAHFSLQATEQLGNATITFTAENADKVSRMPVTMSVRPATPYQTTLISGMNKNASTLITIPRQLYANRRIGNVIASVSPRIFIQGLQLYLDTYPYGCTEQVVSKGLGYLALQPISTETDATKINQKVADTVAILQQRHTSDGGFTYWPRSNIDSFDSQFSTVYAMHFLTEARDKHYAVPDELITTGLSYLRDMATNPIKSLNDARVQAYAIYLLTRNEVVTTNYLTNLQLSLDQKFHDQWRHDIVSSFIAATYKLLKDDKTADMLIKGYQLKSSEGLSTGPIYNSFFDPATSNAMHIYLLAENFPKEFQILGQQGVLTLASSLANNNIDTTSAAYTILALNAYQGGQQDVSSPSLTINEILANGQKHELSSNINLVAPIPYSPAATKLQFINQSPNMYFYQVHLAGYDRSLPNSPITQGLEIEREYWLGNQRLTNIVSQGNDITVHLKIRSLTNNNYNYIAIVDLLPGGFEIVPNSFKGSYDYYDPREDRVVFYTTVTPMVTDITYHIKPIAKGDFTIPPAFAESMYNQRISARGVASRIRVE